MDALIGKKDKAYGLILRGKKAAAQQNKASSTSHPAPEKKNIFGDESDEDDKEFEKKFKNFDSRKETMRAQMKKQTQINLETVLAEDPSVYEYDSIYDSMHADRERKFEVKRDADQRKPKYMAKLLKTAEERKLERELQNDRKVQKELEAEGDQFRDKEKFVTASYKKKMAELKELEEKRKQESLVEDAFDITKQDGLTGFYRYMLHNTDKEKCDEEKSPGARERSPLRNPSPRREEGQEREVEEKREERRSRKEEKRKEASASDEEESRPKAREEKRAAGGTMTERRRKEENSNDEEESRPKAREEKRAAGGTMTDRRRKEENSSDEEERRPKAREEKRAAGGTVTERRRKELALAAQAMFSRRADEGAVSAARARFLARRQNRAGPIVEEDSD